MKRLAALLAAVAASSLIAMAQQPESKIALTPMVEYDLAGIPATAANSLERKLVSMTTANGFASVDGDFLITAVPDLVNSASTPTAPPQFVCDVEVAVYVLNIPEKVIVDQKVYVCKGVGQSEQKAVISAINQINVRSVDTRRFMDNVRTKILDYYAGRLPAIIAKAESLASMTRYEEALKVLSAVPESLDEYPQVAQLMVDIYTDCIDRDAKKLISEAKVQMVQENYNLAMKTLIKIDPNSSLFPQADAMVTQIKAKLDAEKAAELQREMEQYEREKEQAQREYEDNVELQKMKIDAAKEIASKIPVDVSDADEQQPEQSIEEKGRSMIKWLLGNLVE